MSLERYLTPKLMVPLPRTDKKLPKTIKNTYLKWKLSELYPFVKNMFLKLVKNKENKHF